MALDAEWKGCKRRGLIEMVGEKRGTRRRKGQEGLSRDSLLQRERLKGIKRGILRDKYLKENSHS